MGGVARLDTAIWKLEVGCSEDYHNDELWSKDSK